MRRVKVGSKAKLVDLGSNHRIFSSNAYAAIQLSGKHLEDLEGEIISETYNTPCQNAEPVDVCIIRFPIRLNRTLTVMIPVENVIEIIEEDHTGMVYNPYSDRWSFL